LCEPNKEGDIKGSNAEVANDLSSYPAWFKYYGKNKLNDNSNTKVAEHKIKADKMASAFLDYPLFNPNDPYNSSNFDYPSILKSIPKNL